MKVQIEKFDHQGRGIAYIDGIVTFVPKTIPGDTVDIKIIEEKKKYKIGKVNKLVKASINRKDVFCPFYNLCGGCDLQNLCYEESLNYKCEKVRNIFSRIPLDINPIVIENPKHRNYRNKIELQVKNRKVGFYEAKSNNIIEINECLITSNCLNKVIPFISKWNIKDGKVTLRCNKNEEVLIIIDTKDNPNINVDVIKKEVKLVGIVVNRKTVYGENFLFERINNILYKYSFDSFFQINPYVAEKLFNIISENTHKFESILDLFCGVGTLTLTAAKKNNEVVGIEVVPNAVINAINNGKINNLENVKFVLNNVEDAVGKLTQDFSTWIIDPPRSGIDKTTLNVIRSKLPKKIIYVSCDPQTMARDIGDLKDKYEIDKFYILDMFSYTYHIESVCMLIKR